MIPIVMITTAEMKPIKEATSVLNAIAGAGVQSMHEEDALTI
jgi:hypothetical protein